MPEVRTPVPSLTTTRFGRVVEAVGGKLWAMGF